MGSTEVEAALPRHPPVDSHRSARYADAPPGSDRTAVQKPQFPEADDPAGSSMGSEARAAVCVYTGGHVRTYAIRSVPSSMSMSEEVCRASPAMHGTRRSRRRRRRPLPRLALAVVIEACRIRLAGRGAMRIYNMPPRATPRAASNSSQRVGYAASSFLG
jgi:hypothetical protein